MKKVLSMLLVISFIFVGYFPAGAVDVDEGLYSGQNCDCYNEYKCIQKMQSHSKQQLVEAGFTPEEAREILNFDYHDALLKRAQLSNQALAALGYTKEQIQMLKDFANNPEGGINYVATAATLTNSFTRISGTAKTRGLRYSWNWSSAPLAAFSDYIGVRWQAYNSNATPIAATCASGNRSASITYYDLDTGYLAQSVNYTSSITYYAADNDLVLSFPLTKYYSGMNVWAKSGSITFTISSSVDMYYALVQGTYGHKTFTGNISISLGGGYGISFTPSTCISNYTRSIQAYINNFSNL